LAITSEKIKIQGVDSFAEIVSSRQRMVYNTALGIVQNEQDAEDITQEVFVKVFERLNEFRGEANLSTWIYRITVTTSLDFEKQKKRQKRGGFLKRVFSDGAADENPDFDHPGVTLDKKDDAKVLFAAINKLPANQKAAFILNRIEGLTNREIADVLKISLQAAESLQIRAKNNLRSTLKEYYEKHFK
jgi:RNA polymerase sigma factor (sigma-70 family)